MSTAERIVESLLENEPVDPKDFLDRHGDELENAWEHISGDRDAWTYGGAFYNPVKEEIVYIPGLESEGIRDYEADDFELTEQEMAEIMAQFPEAIDPEFPEYGDDNEREREDAIEAKKQWKADEANDIRKMTVYRFLDEPVDWPEDDLDAIRQQFDPGVFDSLPSAAQWIEIGNYRGFHELDHYPEKYTKAEMEKYLNRKL